jgi:hypothetical protein
VRGCFKAVGCLASALLLLVVIGGGIGAITWYSDTCTVDTSGASLTLQGWGSADACQDIINSKTNDVMQILHWTSGGIVGDSAMGSPYSVENCEGWDGSLHYSVSHESVTENPLRWAEGNVEGHLFCSRMPSTNPFNHP